MFAYKKSIKGFTLVEIIVVLVILAILAASTIPSMLGFVDVAKEKALTSEVKAVYTAMQAYATEQSSLGTSDENIINKLNGTLNSEHCLYGYLKNDVTGVISSAVVENGKVISFSYATDKYKIDYSTVDGVKFSKSDSESTSTPISKNTTFYNGLLVAIKMKELAGNANASYGSKDTNIQGFLKADSLAEGIDTSDENHILSTSDAEYPIYAWYENNNIYYFTEADNIFLNVDSSCLFHDCQALTNISGLQYVNTSNVTSLDSIFYDCTSLTDISALANWDTSNVTGLAKTFQDCTSLTDISALANWDTSNVTSLAQTFRDCTSLTDISALANWDTSNVTDLAQTFRDCTSLTDISALANWDTSKVIDLNSIFYDCTSLSDISALANWDTSNVTNLENTFKYCRSLTDATCLNSWDTSKVTNKAYTFDKTPAATNGKLPSWY